MSDFNLHLPSAAVGFGVGALALYALYGRQGSDTTPVLQDNANLKKEVENLKKQVAQLGQSTLSEDGRARVILGKIEEEIHVSRKRLSTIVQHMIEEMRKGLEKEGATVRMIPTYVTRRPTGRETGTFLALDLGGTNFRVCEAVLDGKGRPTLETKAFVVGDDLKTGTAEQLFDFLAECILKFLEREGAPTRKSSDAINLGFTFSFPISQTAVDRGNLIQWSKGFTASGAVGNDVVTLLQDALKRKDVAVNVVAVLNDTVGTLLAAAVEEPATICGVILGTGTNAAYYEKISAIPKLAGVKVEGDEMLINTEWGAFDNEGQILPISKYDRLLDEQSSNPGEQRFEKMISGMYLGEVVRQILVDLSCKEGVLFGGLCSKTLSNPYSFQTAYMARCERDHSAELQDIKALLKEVFGLPDVSYPDRLIVKNVCEMVAIRAARLSAGGIAAVLEKTKAFDSGMQVVAVDGSVFEKYPHFKNRMTDALHELFGMRAQDINMILARDGSGTGAAVLASLYK